MIQTAHIQQMLTDAQSLAVSVHGREEGERIVERPGVGRDVRDGLRRAATLAAHAAAELQDELDRLDGWE